MAQSFDGGATFNHFTVTDEPWDPTLDAPWSHGDSSVTFIGDYFGLDAGANGFLPAVDRHAHAASRNSSRRSCPERQCSFVVNRSTIGQDEVDARRKYAGGTSAVIPDAFRVVVDGFDRSADRRDRARLVTLTASRSRVGGMTHQLHGERTRRPATTGPRCSASRSSTTSTSAPTTPPSAFRSPTTKFVTLNARGRRRLGARRRSS